MTRINVAFHSYGGKSRPSYSYRSQLSTHSCAKLGVQPLETRRDANCSPTQHTRKRSTIQLWPEKLIPFRKMKSHQQSECFTEIQIPNSLDLLRTHEVPVIGPTRVLLSDQPLHKPRWLARASTWKVEMNSTLFQRIGGHLLFTTYLCHTASASMSSVSRFVPSTSTKSTLCNLFFNILTMALSGPLGESGIGGLWNHQ